MNFQFLTKFKSPRAKKSGCTAEPYSRKLEEAFSDTPQGQIILTLSSDRKNSASAPGPTCEPVTGS